MVYGFSATFIARGANVAVRSITAPILYPQPNLPRTQIGNPDT